jgi:lipopolysaccharide transport system ATP-binding protein
MKVRLAFSVAAHLDPDILIVDEVLAVGDAEFQRRALTKMESVYERGRTVFFVSHQLAMIERLCTRCILLDGGRIKATGTPSAVIADYLGSFDPSHGADLTRREDRKGNGSLRFQYLRVIGGDLGSPDAIVGGETMTIQMRYRSMVGDISARTISVNVNMYDMSGNAVFTLDNLMGGAPQTGWPENGSISCTVETLPLLGGTYSLGINIWMDGVEADWLRPAVMVHVSDGDFYGTGYLPEPQHGRLLLHHSWKIEAGPGHGPTKGEVLHGPR